MSNIYLLVISSTSFLNEVSEELEEYFNANRKQLKKEKFIT